MLSLLGRRMLAGGGFWDPAYGRVGGDASVVAALFLDGEGNQYLHRIAYLTADPNLGDDPATQQCRAVATLGLDRRVGSLARGGRGRHRRAGL